MSEAAMNRTLARRRVAVVGSLNMDLVVRTPRMVEPGETLAGRDFVTAPGGKGANQAVAAARLGAEVAMIGRVGRDAFGARLLDDLRGSGVDAEAVEMLDEAPTGVAVITVDDAGENSIIIVAGANGRLTPADVEASSQAIASADVLLLQLEVPMETVEAAVRVARRHGTAVALDPAPMPDEGLGESLLGVDLLMPNRGEAQRLVGGGGGPGEPSEKLAASLRARGPAAVVLKLGGDGAIALGAEGEACHCPAFAVEVVDTTAAGDAFSAAVAVARAEGRSLEEAVRFGCAAGALTASKLGAQPALPTRSAVEARLGEGGSDG